jgi:multidrug resistance efflux pump
MHVANELAKILSPVHHVMTAIVDVIGWFGRPVQGIVQPPAMVLFERRLVCATMGALGSSMLAIAPAVFAALVVDRALASRSLETVVVLGIGTLVLIMMQVGLAYAGRQYLIEGWRALGVSVGRLQLDDGAKRGLAAIDGVVSSNYLWEALSVLALPLMAALLTAVHPTLMIMVAIIGTVMVLAERFGATVVSQFIIGASSVAMCAMTAYLVLNDAASMGGLVAASILGARILTPILVLAKAWPQLVIARKAYLAFRSQQAFRKLSGDATHDLAANGHARLVVVLNIAILAVIGGLAVTPLPQVVVLQGRAVADGHSKVIRSTTPGRVETVLVREGDDVQLGQPLIELDRRALIAQLAETERQAQIERDALAFGSKSHAERAALLKTTVDTIEGLTRKGLKPEAELIAARLRSADFTATWQNEATTRNTTLSKLTAQRVDLDRQIDSATILAPATGRVQQLAGLGKGSSIAPQDQLLVLVPESLSLIEAQLTAADRGSVRIGDKVEIRIKTSKSRYSDTISGTIATISADVAGKDRDTAFMVQIRTADPVRTGSEAEAVIVTAPGSAAGWLYDVISGAIRRTPR